MRRTRAAGEVRLDGSPLALIVASDGLWDKLSDEEAAEIVRKEGAPGTARSVDKTAGEKKRSSRTHF